MTDAQHIKINQTFSGFLDYDWPMHNKDYELLYDFFKNKGLADNFIEAIYHISYINIIKEG